MNSAHRYRVGIIGLGRVGWEMERDPLRAKPCSHWGAWCSRSDIDLVAGCDLDAEKRAAFAAANPGARLYADYRRMLERESLDMLSICAYADTRAEMVVAAAQAGVSGIWCEKAMACSLLEVQRMEAALERSGTRMIVSFMRRWVPEYRQAAGLIHDGLLGSLESLSVHFSSNMLHTGTHAFDVMRMWCGEVVAAQAWLDESSAQAADSGYRYDPEEGLMDFGGFAVLHFDNGVRAAVHGGRKEYFRFEFELLGSRGMLRLGNGQRELWTAAPSDQYTDFRELHRAELAECAPANMWQAACGNLVEMVRGGASPACSIRDGAQSLGIALAMHLSHREGHRRVAVSEVPKDLWVPSR